MTSDLNELARRAVACNGWRWMPGMLAVRVEEPPFVSEGFDASKLLNRAYRVLHITKEGMVHCYAEAFRAASTAYAPDLSDPATLGCLLALVRDAWGDPRAYLCDFGGYDSVEWGVVSHEWDAKRQAEGPKAWFSCLVGDADTEAGALVLALEAAHV